MHCAQSRFVQKPLPSDLCNDLRDQIRHIRWEFIEQQCLFDFNQSEVHFF
jgi:hypothetical protein